MQFSDIIQMIYSYMVSNIRIEFLNRSLWLRHGTLTGTSIQGQSGPGINIKVRVLQTSQIFILGSVRIKKEK